MLHGQKSCPLMTVGAASRDESTPINGALIPHFCMQPKQNPMAAENPCCLLLESRENHKSQRSVL